MDKARWTPDVMERRQGTLAAHRKAASDTVCTLGDRLSLQN